MREIVGEGLVLLPDGKGFQETLWGFFWKIWEDSEVRDVGVVLDDLSLVRPAELLNAVNPWIGVGIIMDLALLHILLPCVELEGLCGPSRNGRDGLGDGFWIAGSCWGIYREGKVAELLPSLVVGFRDDKAHGASLNLACAQEMVVGDDRAFGAEVLPVFPIKAVVILEDGIVEMARITRLERAGNKFRSVEVYEVKAFWIGSIWL